MQNKSNQNGGKGRKKPVKKQQSLNDIIDEQNRLAEEMLRKSEESLEQSKRLSEIIDEFLENSVKRYREQQKQKSPQELKCEDCPFKNDCYLRQCSEGFRINLCDMVREHYADSGGTGFRMMLRNFGNHCSRIDIPESFFVVALN